RDRAPTLLEMLRRDAHLRDACLLLCREPRPPAPHTRQRIAGRQALPDAAVARQAIGVTRLAIAFEPARNLDGVGKQAPLVVGAAHRTSDDTTAVRRRPRGSTAHGRAYGGLGLRAQGNGKSTGRPPSSATHGAA